MLEIERLEEELKIQYPSSLSEETQKKRLHNIKTLQDFIKKSIDDHGLSFGKKEMRLYFYTTKKDEKVGIQFPGKESEQTVKRIANNKASSAYTHREYTTAYKMLYGKELTEDQSIIYEQSRVLAWAQRYLSGYENYVAMNMKEEALDMLLMGMRNKEDLLEEATKFNVEFEVQGVYSNIESLLLEKYGLSETDISDINSIKKERDYTIRLMEIVGTL